MQEQDNRVLSYSQQRKLFKEIVGNLQGTLQDSHSLDNKTISDWLRNTTTCVFDDDKYYSLIYFYYTYSQINDFSNLSSVKQLVFVLACMLAEKIFKTNNNTLTDLLNFATSQQFNYSIITGAVAQKRYFSLSPEDKNFISFQIQGIVLKGMFEELQKKLDHPESQFNTFYTTLKNKEEEIENTLSQHQDRADKLVAFIQQQHSNLNFISLGKAFEQITKEKNTVKNNIEKYLIGFFIPLLVVPLIVAVTLYFQEHPNYYLCISAATIELLILYAFRLCYQQYLSVKSELLQVNLRYNLCAFIESYMNFKKDNKDNTVDLFEQLIFSNIISDEKKVPATVDGLDGLARMIETIKGK